MGEIEFKRLREMGCAKGARSRTKQPDDLSVHRFFHLDKRRPGAFETFARQFVRRVEAEFAADGDFAGGGKVTRRVVVFQSQRD